MRWVDNYQAHPLNGVATDHSKNRYYFFESSDGGVQKYAMVLLTKDEYSLLRAQRVAFLRHVQRGSARPWRASAEATDLIERVKGRDPAQVVPFGAVHCGWLVQEVNDPDDLVFSIFPTKESLEDH